MADDLDVDALLEASLATVKNTQSNNTTSSESTQSNGDADSLRDSRSRDSQKDSKRPSERERERRSRDRDRDRSGRKRSRSRSRSPKRRRSRSRSRSPKRGRYGRSPPRRFGGGGWGGGRGGGWRGSGRGADKPREETPEDKMKALMDKEQEAINEAERDARTVFAQNLPIRATESELFEFFGRAGKVRDVSLISDRNSRKSKGFGYIEYHDKLCVPAALQLSGTQLKGQTIIVQLTQAERNRAVTQQVAAPPPSTGPTRLYVTDLHLDVTKRDVEQIFGLFGTIESIILQTEAGGKSKGVAYVNYAQSEDANKALQRTDHLEIAGQLINVGFVDESRPMPFGVDLGMGGALVSDLDSEEGGLLVNAQSRQLLMQKLQQRPGVTGIGGPVATPGFPAAQQPMVASVPTMMAQPLPEPPSTCLLLKNMFDPATETEPDFDSEIAEDVGTECGKYGRVVHLKVIKESQGYVYVKMDSVESASKVQATLNRRWFAGKMITAEFVKEPYYNSLHRLA